MKKITLLLLFLSLASCARKVVPEPETLLSSKEMEAIVYDLALLNAMAQTKGEIFKEKGITPMGYIFKKHKIDSLIYAQNDLYYAAKPVVYEKIYRSVEQKLQALKKNYDKASKAATSLE